MSELVLDADSQFICSKCKKVYRSAESLCRHEKRCTGEILVFRCASCDASYASAHCLAEHEKCHSGERPYACLYCEKRFMTSNTRRSHVRNVHVRNKPYKCDECGMKFKRAEHVKKHKNAVHSGNKQLFRCPVCGKNLSSPHRVQMHKLMHAGERPYVCTICDKKLMSKASLDCHERGHRGERPYSCSQCDKTYINLKTARAHEKLAHNKWRNPFKCRFCVLMFESSDKKFVHMKIHHRDEFPFSCDHCGKVFQLEYYFFHHQCASKRGVARLEGEDELSTALPLNASQDIMQGIRQAEHFVKGRYPCTQCSKTFSAKSTLDTHLKAHSGERPFPCKECKQAFVYKYRLQMHELSHERQRKAGLTFVCSECDKSFSDHSTLKRHVVDIHATTAQRFVCGMCDNVYSTQNSLRTHYNKYHGIRKVVVCYDCSKTFRSVYLLKRHQEKVHSHDVNSEPEFLPNGIARQYVSSSKPLGPALSNCHVVVQKLNLSISKPGSTGIRDSGVVALSGISVFACVDCDGLFEQKADFERHRLGGCSCVLPLTRDDELHDD